MNKWLKTIASYSRGKKNKKWDITIDDASVFNEKEENEDCTFVNDKNGAPLICCDGVGGSKNSRKASRKLTEILSETKYEDINEITIRKYISKFRSECVEKEASTTCISVWPFVKNGLLYLKTLQLGDGMAYITLKDKKGKYSFYNLATCPTHQTDVQQDLLKDQTSDVQALYELTSENIESCMNVPIQVSPTTAMLKNIYFSLGEEYAVDNTPLTLGEAILRGYFLKKTSFQIDDISSFEIFVASDGIYDNIDNYSLFKILTSNKNKAYKIFDHCLSNFNYSKHLTPRNGVEFISYVLGSVSVECHNAIMDIYNDINVFSYDELFTHHRKKIDKIHKCLRDFYVLFSDSVCIYKNIIELFSNTILQKGETKNLKNMIRFYQFILKSLNVCKIDDLSIVSIKYERNQ